MRNRGGRYEQPSTSERQLSSESSRLSSVTPRKQKTATKITKSLVGVFVSCFSAIESPEFKSSVQYDGAGSSNSTVPRILDGGESGPAKFTMSEICKATMNFSAALKIGQGGFGTVYKGTLEDGTVVAIKRAKKSIHDTHSKLEFQREVLTLSRVDHLNLVRFLGFLEHEDEKIVVEEYVPNGTVRDHLDRVHNNNLDLGLRLEIAVDVAHAITYLHMYTDNPIIHRDIKSSNILLTETCRAKVADFGFARLVTDTDIGATHISTQVKGTAGYLDPEYLNTYQLTEKSDVYSFGVLLVELVTGRRPLELQRDSKERVTLKWAFNKFSDEGGASAMDPKLPRTSANVLAVERIFELALRCVSTKREARPSMQKCAAALWQIRKEYKSVASSCET